MQKAWIQIWLFEQKDLGTEEILIRRDLDYLLDHFSHLFLSTLNAGSMFTFSGFDVVSCNQNFRLSDSLLAIRFSDSTNFDALAEPASPILVELSGSVIWILYLT